MANLHYQLVDKTKFLYTTSPPTQHHSFFRNYPFLQTVTLTELSNYVWVACATIGEVVSVEENLLSSRWRLLSRLDKLFEGNDDLCRAAQVKLASGFKIHRSIQLLYPLEVQDSVSEENES